MHRPHLPAALLLLALALPAAPAALAQAPGLPAGCDTFAWDVSRELAVLQSPAATLDAGTGRPGADGVHIALETRHDVRLHPQQDVALAARPGKPMLDDDARAGLLAFRVPADGRYRVSITTGHWIDVVDGGSIVPSLDFQGRRGCPLVHKIVEFELPAGRDLVLQFAGGSAGEAGVAVTAVDPTAR